ncbi:response regulator [Micromonospora halophytica]|uniref:Two component transcriptional regulator, LuxR family n=1 Tax=Micromonospora halophytica TaxID=47864 RepID=A0A1C5JFG6_9ACTN|nr:response regulator transcription factor [Micromonospora halophytica]SCG69324.1 two component transcriptional regulator, LuxR family [Micromonospora halophytica]
MTIRVLICDQLPVIADGLKTLLDAVPGIEVIGTTQNGMEAIILVRTTHPDVVVTDLNLQTISGLEMIRRLAKEEEPPQIVVFTAADTDQTVSDLLHAGASCLFGKDASPQELITAIQGAAAGQTILAPTIAERLVSWFRAQPEPRTSETCPELTKLTPREREVTRLVAEGMSTEDVARELIIGEATVRTHLYRVRTKLGVRDRAELVSLAYRTGLTHSAVADRSPGDRRALVRAH